MLLLPPSLDHHRHARCRRSSGHGALFPPLPSSPLMNEATLRSLALRGGGYSTPRLNDSLHANSAGLVGFGVFTNDDENGDDENADGENDDENDEKNTENKKNISPLAAYSSLKSLHLSDNGFESLEGMPLLGELRCL